MEQSYTANHYIIKNPTFMANIENIIKDESIKIKKIIIPIRDYESSAISRVSHNKNKGGLWNATDKKSQIEYYKDIISNYIYISTKYDINTIFIDFGKMVNNKKYLFNKIKSIIDEKNINFKFFCDVYDEISYDHQKKLKKKIREYL